MNKRGPIIDPCGTPISSIASSDIEPFTLTLKERSERYDLSQQDIHYANVELNNRGSLCRMLQINQLT